MYSKGATLATYKGWVYESDMSQETWDLSLEVSKMAALTSGIDVVIPTGMALYSYLTTYLGTDPSVIYSDGVHLSNLGLYIAACASFAAIITPIYNESVLGNTYRVQGIITEAEAEAAQLVAMSASADSWNYRDMSSEIIEP